MPKIKPERIAGIVALSYLVLIPTGALYLHQKVKQIDADLDKVYNRAGLARDEALGIGSNLRQLFGIG